MPWLIKPIQLDKFRKNQKNVAIFDASWHLHSESRYAEEEFHEGHIPSARFLNLDLFHDATATLPNMLIRDEEAIRRQLSALNLTNDHKIIFYDNSNLYTSCRALWMLKVFGHNPNQLYILDGGFKAWQRYGGKIEIGQAKNSPAKTYNVNFEAHFIRTLLQMKTNLHHPQEQVIDLRHPIRYAGGAEPRPNVRAGHMPNSFSFPYQTMFDSEGSWKSIEKIRKQLNSIGVQLDEKIITLCGSGISAAILNFALDLMNQNNNSLYDGSWAEWGSTELYPGESDISERPVIKSTE